MVFDIILFCRWEWAHKKMKNIEVKINIIAIKAKYNLT